MHTDRGGGRKTRYQGKMRPDCEQYEQFWTDL